MAARGLMIIAHAEVLYRFWNVKADYLYVSYL